MSALGKRYRRNFVVALVLHVGIVAAIVLIEHLDMYGSPPEQVAIEADYLGDLPKGQGVGRGNYRAPEPPGGGGGAPVSPSSEPAAAPPDETVPAPARASLPKAQADEVAVTRKSVVKKPVAEEKPAAAASSMASARKNTSMSPPKTVAAQKPKTSRTGAGTGMGTGKSAEEIRNDLARALGSSDDGTPGGDGKKAGGGSGNGPIGSPDGEANGVVGGHGHGTPNWEYYRHVHDVLYEAWEQPGDGVDKNLKTTIHLRIARDGTISDVSVRISSGSRTMDESVLSAVRKVKHLEPPPDAIVSRGYVDIPVDFQEG